MWSSKLTDVLKRETEDQTTAKKFLIPDEGETVFSTASVFKVEFPLPWASYLEKDENQGDQGISKYKKSKQIHIHCSLTE